jgi:hypothetical protein
MEIDLNQPESDTETSEFVPKSDEEYYGEIPNNITLNDLKIIMVGGLKAYRDHANECGEPFEYSLVLDSWFSNDATGDNKFDYLVSRDDMNEFFEEVASSL